MKKLLFVVLIPIFVCTFITSCQDNKEEEIPEIDFEALKEMTEEFAEVGIQEIRKSVERSAKGHKNSIYASVSAFANTELGKAMSDLQNANPRDYPQFSGGHISEAPDVWWMSSHAKREFRNFMYDIYNLYDYNSVLSKASTYTAKSGNDLIQGLLTAKERNALVILYYTMAAYSKKFHTPDFRNYLNSIARNKGCCNWKAVWTDAVFGGAIGAGWLGAKGCIVGTVTVPVLGTATGCVGGAVLGGASGFIMGAAQEILGQLAT